MLTRLTLTVVLCIYLIRKGLTLPTMQVLGTPTREDIHAMNPNYTEFKFPHIKAHPWSKVFSKRLPADAVDLVSAQPSPCCVSEGGG